MKIRILFTFILAFLPWALLSGASAAQQYVYRDLGDLGGGHTYSLANGINDSGLVVGESYDGTNFHAFLWTGTMNDLGDLGGGYSTAYAINNLDQIVGSSTVINSSTGDTELHPFLWSSGQTPNLKDLGNLGNGGWAEALALNGNGLTAGYYTVFSSPDTFNYAFTWDPAAGLQTLPTLLNSVPYAVGQGINDQGQVVGRSDDPTGNTRAFLYHPDTGTMDNLGILGGSESTANAINNNGQIVGGSDTSQGAWHAFIWDSTNLMQDLGSLYGDSEAYAINDKGQVVGAFALSYDNSSAFVWTQAGGMQDLNNLVVNLPPGEHLNVAYGINKRGQIVGNTFDGRAFLLTPTRIPVPVIFFSNGLFVMDLLD